jgi:chromosome segregation ATPase
LGVVSRQKARKEYKCGKCGAEISKGDEYYRIKKAFQRVRFRCKDHRPRPSELATSGKKATLLGIQETFQDLQINSAEDVQGAAQELESQADEAEGVADEYDESADNMEEYFSGSSQIDDIREKAENVREWAEELRGAAGNLNAEEVEALEDERDKKAVELEGIEEDEDEKQAAIAGKEAQEEYDALCEQIEEKLQEARDIVSEASDSLEMY